MTQHIIPWFLAKEYDAIKRLAKNDPNTPNTYNEWFKFATDQIADFKTKGITPKQVIVHPDEFAAFCERQGVDCDCIQIGRFAHFKSPMANE